MLLIDPFSLNQISQTKQIYAWKEVIPKGPTVLALTYWRRKHKGSHYISTEEKLGVKCQGKKNLVTSDSGLSPKLPQMDQSLSITNCHDLQKKQKTKNFYEILYI